MHRLTGTCLCLFTCLAAIGCTVHANSDRRMAVDSRGGHVWREFWRTAGSIDDLNPEVGYSPIHNGNSFMQIISWDKSGKLDPRAIVTYSQSPEPDSAHYADMTRLYAKGEWISLPFEEAEIEADPNLETLILSSRSAP